ncbi:MAG: hypothetical protein ACRCVM_01745, partial [Giesbergeria sp.]
NEAFAYRHYLSAALNGDVDSLAEVGRCLYHGIGVARDRKTAEILLENSKNDGFEGASPRFFVVSCGT